MEGWEKVVSHNKISKHCLSWICNRATQRGIRGNTEVWLDEKYVTDAFALCRLQSKFNRDYINEWNGISEELACVFEVKVSRPDFLKTFRFQDMSNNRAIPIGNLHWCVVRKGSAEPKDVPNFWGFIEVRGSRFYELKKPTYTPMREGELERLAHNLLWTGHRLRCDLACPDCGGKIG